MRGFTLIELLIVMLIGGVILSLVGPVSFQQYQRTQFLKEREQLYRIVEHSRFNAFLSRTAAELVFQDNQITYNPGAQQTQWQFELLQFAPQQLTVNGNGFWQQQALVWQEQDRPWQLVLNPEPLQHNTMPVAPIGSRLASHSPERP